MKDRNIINGVDVSGCIFCKDGWKCTSENVCSDSCKLVPDCIYKLKILLQERRKEIYKLNKTMTDIKKYCTDIKKDHYWGMRIIRFANEILQKLSEVEND